MENKWLKFSKSKEYEVVEGQKALFDAVSIRTIYRVHDVIKSNKKATTLMAYLFVDKSKDANTTQTKTADGTEQIVVAEISPNLAAMRQKDLNSGIEGIIDLIASPASQELLAELIYESSSREWRECESKKEALKIIMSLPTPVFIGFVIGSLKAQTGAISTLGKLFPQIQNSTVTKVKEAIEDLG